MRLTGLSTGRDSGKTGVAAGTHTSPVTTEAFRKRAGGSSDDSKHGFVQTPQGLFAERQLLHFFVHNSPFKTLLTSLAS